MAKLTDDQLAFLQSQSIDISDMFDTSGIPRKVWPEIMKKLGKKYAYGDGVTPCEKAGHTLRNRKPGHCIQCNTSLIAYGSRHAAKGRLYIAGSKSGRYIKIGMTDDDLDHRFANLRSLAYGGCADWKLLAVTRTIENSGAVEHAAQSALAKHKLVGASIRAGQKLESRELFGCGFGEALKAVRSVLPSGHDMELRCSLSELVRYEWKRAA